MTDTSVHVFTDFFARFDKVVLQVGSDIANNMINYVVPIAWVALGVMMLTWAGAIFFGNGSPVADWFKKLGTAVLIIQFASVFYISWVATPLIALSSELASAVSGATSTDTSAADQLAGGLEQLVLGVVQASVEALKHWNVGGALLLLIGALLMAAAGCLLLIGVIFNLLYAKVGITYMVAIGPLYVFFLTLPAVRSWFFNWLNTGFYFIMLTVISTLTSMIFLGIANDFMTKLAEAVGAAGEAKVLFAKRIFAGLVKAMTLGMIKPKEGTVIIDDVISAEFNVISIAIQMLLIFIPMFLVVLETRTLVGSLTGGSGGSFGSGMVNVISTAWRGGVGRLGGGKK